MPLAVKDANGASQTINTLPAVGQAAAGASLPVVLASDQGAIPVSAASLPLPAGAATAAGITSLSGAITSALAPTGGLPVALQGTAAVTQSGTWTVALAANATVALAGGNTVALKVDGSAVTQPVSGTVTVGSLPALPAGSNAIGTVAVSNLPTIGQKTSSGSVSTDQASNGVIATAYGTVADTATPDITANGASFTFTSLFKGIAANTKAIADRLLAGIGVTVAPYGLGAFTAMVTPSTNGTPLSASPPAGKRGARLYVPPGGSISFTVAASQPASAPTTITVANPSSNTVPANWDEDLAGTQMIYVTAVTGSPLFRWY